MNPLDKALHHRALEIAAKQRHIDGELLEILQRIDERKVFRKLGYTSLFDYAVKALKQSDAVAYNFITVARKAKEIPQMKEEVLAGRLSVATARKIAPVVAKENVGLWIEKAQTLTKPQLEKEVAKIHPQVLTPEKAKYVAEKRIAISLGVSEEAYEKLKRVKDIVSQKSQKAASLEETLLQMMDLYLEKHDPIQKAQRAKVKSQETSESDSKPVPGQVFALVSISDDQTRKNPRPKLPATVKHAVMLRDQGQCSFQMGSGGRCEQKRWLHVHHVIHRSQGGADRSENLTLLCSGHHRMVHNRHQR